jgi:hypothetical protein
MVLVTVNIWIPDILKQEIPENRNFLDLGFQIVSKNQTIWQLTDLSHLKTRQVRYSDIYKMLFVILASFSHKSQKEIHQL